MHLIGRKKFRSFGGSYAQQFNRQVVRVEAEAEKRNVVPAKMDGGVARQFEASQESVEQSESCAGDRVALRPTAKPVDCLARLASTNPPAGGPTGDPSATPPALISEATDSKPASRPSAEPLTGKEGCSQFAGSVASA